MRVILTNQQTFVVKVCTNQQHPRILFVAEQKGIGCSADLFRPNIEEKERPSYARLRKGWKEANSQGTELPPCLSGDEMEVDDQQNSPSFQVSN